jgi:hypothetical protein
MIISELKLYNFRKFKSTDGNPGLSISFHKGLNALIRKRSEEFCRIFEHSKNWR